MLGDTGRYLSMTGKDSGYGLHSQCPQINHIRQHESSQIVANQTKLQYMICNLVHTGIMLLKMTAKRRLEHTRCTTDMTHNQFEYYGRELHTTGLVSQAEQRQ